MKPRIGIITANYNNGKYFREYLNGLLNQTVKPDYIVFVDDCSKDDSLSLVRSYLDALSKKVKEYHNAIEADINGIKFVAIKGFSNGGPAVARNTALKNLDGKVDIIGVCDSDDVYYPTKIEKSIAPFLNYPHVGLVYSDYDVYNQKTGTTAREFKEIFDHNKLVRECIVSNNSFYRYDIVKNVGFYDEDREIISVEDFQLWIKIASLSSVYHIPESLYKYRVHGDNLTVITNNDSMNKRHVKMRQNLTEWMKNRK